MSKIVFLNDPNTVYDGKFTQIGNHQVKLVFTDDMPTNDVLLSGFNLINEHNGRVQTRREDYIYLYRTYTDSITVELCNDNNPYIEPDIVINFTAGFGGTIDGEAKQIVDSYEDLIIPTPLPNENYEFIGWSPEIPTSGKVEKNATYTAQFAYVTTVEEIRTAKISEFNAICNATIEAGQDITLSDGSVRHFTYTQYDQINMKTAFDLAVATKETVPFYDSNNKCNLFSPVDIATIYSACQSYVTYMVTLDHQLEEMIHEMEDKDAISVLVFGEESLDEAHLENFNTIMAQAQVVADKYMAQITESLSA